MGNRGKILTNAGDKRRLREIFGVSYPTVRAALAGKTQSELARKIRHTAVTQLGCVETPACGKQEREQKRSDKNGD